MATDETIRDLNTLAQATTAPPLTDLLMIYPAAGFSPPGTPDATADIKADANPQRPTSLALIRRALGLPETGETIRDKLTALEVGSRLSLYALDDIPSSITNAGTTLTRVAQLNITDAVTNLGITLNTNRLYWVEQAAGAFSRGAVLRVGSRARITLGNIQIEFTRTTGQVFPNGADTASITIDLIN